MTGIYKITSPNGRIYIGQAINIERRFKEYKNIKKSKLQIKLNRSFNKYGIENHIFEIAEQCNKKELNNRERHYQDFYNVISKKGLNCVLTKSDDRSGKLSEETKLKISLANLGKIKSEESRLLMGVKNKGKVASEETRLKMSRNRKGKKLSREHCENISKGQLGKKLSEEHKLKLSNAKKGKFQKGLSVHARKIINIETGKIYNSIIDASISENINYNCLISYLRGTNINKTALRYAE